MHSRISTQNYNHRENFNHHLVNRQPVSFRAFAGSRCSHRIDLRPRPNVPINIDVKRQRHEIAPHHIEDAVPVLGVTNFNSRPQIVSGAFFFERSTVAYAVAAIRFLRRPTSPSTPSPPAKSDSAPGIGVGAGGSVRSKLIFGVMSQS